MTRRVLDLHPAMQALHTAFIQALDDAGLDVLVYCTWRSNDEQAAEYAKGRTAPGKVVTWARPGQSNHNYTLAGKPASLAFDCVPIRNGKLPAWGTRGNGIDNDPTDDDTDDLELWQRIGAIGKAVGLAWAGDWAKPKREFPHFEHPNAKAIKARGE